jgi:hypothetical protein
MTRCEAARNEDPNPEIAHPQFVVADMPIVVTLLLYLSCVSALTAASGIGLSMLIESDRRVFIFRHHNARRDHRHRSGGA